MNMSSHRVAGGAASPAPVVLSPVHVSCFITAANRATPVFEVVPERRCVRVVTKPLGDPPPGASATPSTSAGASSSGNAATSVTGSSSTSAVPSAEWDVHTLFASWAASHASDFYRDITQPAFESVCDGWNTNIVAWGVHPTQKFRLLFGKSTGVSNSTPASSSTHGSDDKEVLELYGQLGGLLHAFFAPSRAGASVRTRHASMTERGWRVGISSWIIVNNQVIDVLKPALSTSSSTASAAPSRAASTPPPSSGSTSQAPLSFVSVEAKTFAQACRALQIAKTNRIVMKQNAEHAHFFLRLAFFHDGQVSTMHFVDLVDLKDFRDAVSLQEKQELFDILHDLRQPPLSPRQSITASFKTASGAFGSAPSTPKPASRKMVLSNFMLPLLTANAKTFLYANVIDSRASLRESVQLLNTVANVKGYACACKRLCGIEFMQLGFQALPDDLAPTSTTGAHDETKAISSVQDAAAKALAAVAVGESLLSRLAASSSSSSISLGSIAALPSPLASRSRSSATPLASPLADLSSLLSTEVTCPLSRSTVQHEQQLQEPSSSRRDSFSSVPMESETLAWLESFSQRKREILGGHIDTVVPLRTHPHLDGASTSATAKPKLLDSHIDIDSSHGGGDSSVLSSAAPKAHTLSFDAAHAHASSTMTSAMVAQTSADLLERLREAMGASSAKSKARDTSSEPLPITDTDVHTLDDYAPSPRSSWEEHDSRQHAPTEQQSPWATPTQATTRQRLRMASSSPFPPPSPHTTPSAAVAIAQGLSTLLDAAPASPSLVSPLPLNTSRASLPERHAQRSSDNEALEAAAAASKTPALSRPALSPHVSQSITGATTTTTAAPALPLMLQRGQQLYETLERANVPPQAMAPANVDGLDAVTVSKIQATEAALLRKNYDALLTIVQEQQQLREAAEAKAAEAVHELDEVRASFEVQIENMKLVHVSLRSKVRALEKQSALPKVFEQYEQELQALSKEVQQLRERNVALELKVRV